MRIYSASFPVPSELIGAGGAYEIERRQFLGQDHEMFKHGPRTLSETLARATAFNRRHPLACMSEQNGTVTNYGEFEACATSLARTLSDTFGIHPGEHVAIAMANRVEWMIAFFAITAIGAVPVLINSRGAGEEMSRAITLTGCRASVSDHERHALLCAYAAPTWRSVLVDAPDLIDEHNDLDFAAIQPQPGSELRFVDRDPESASLIMFSSGTMGHPKAIMHSQGGMAHALSLGCLMNETYDLLYERELCQPLLPELRNSTSTSILASPMFHIAGLLPYLRTIMVGKASILITKWNTEAVFNVLERETVSRLGLVPTMIFDMLRSPRAAGGALSNLRFLASGTAALSPQITQQIRTALPLCLLYNTYGQTETIERVSTIAGREFEAKCDTVGRVIPTTQVRILRDDGSDAAAGEPGEICVRSPCTMLGFHNDAAATAETLQDGWLRTGDVGQFDEQGLLSIIDRKKNMVISGGENIYCAEVERVLGEHPDAIEAIAYGESDARLGQRLVAVVVLKPGAVVSEDDIKVYAKKRLAIYKVPRCVSFIHAPLPRTATGKVARGAFISARTAAS